MKMTVTRDDFVETLFRLRPGQFSSEALRDLFDFYEEFEESSGTEVDFDPIAICCDWTEYDDIKEAEEAYSVTREELLENTMVRELDGMSVLVLNY